jgi:hypothetical protein
MAEFLEKSKNLFPSFLLKPGYVPDIDPFISVETQANDRLRIPTVQLPDSCPFENYNINRNNASGSITTVLQTGGQVQVLLTRGQGSGQLAGPFYLRMEVTNTSGSNSSYNLPVPLWIQNIQYNTPSGQPVATQDGQGLWNNIIEEYDDEEWYSMQRAIGSNEAWGNGYPILPNGSSTYYIPLIGNPLSPGKWMQPATAGDFQVLINFLAPAFWNLASVNLNLTALSIDAPQSQLSAKGLDNLIREYKAFSHYWFYPYEKVQTVTQNLNTSSTYQIPLTSFNGPTSMVRIAIYNSLSGKDLYSPVPLSSFQFFNNAGGPISGNNVTDDIFNRLIQQPKFFRGRASRRIRKYAWIWTKDQEGAQRLIKEGTPYPGYPMTTKEYIQFTTPVAGTNEVVTLTPSTAPSSGTFQILFTNPDVGDAITQPIAYNATAATIQSAINNLINFSGSCTVTGTMASTVVITFTGGGYQNRTMDADGFSISVLDNAMLGTTYTVGIESAVTTAGVSGIVNGNSYTIKMWGYGPAIGEQTSEGNILVRIT